MRIIGGSKKGRPLDQPATDKTRPLTDMAREAVFDVLGDITGLKVLDLYAGSGALGLEALSRGAKSVEAVEVAKLALLAIKQNVDRLGFNDQYVLHQQPVEKWLLNADDTYNLIFADPPFDQLNSSTLNQAVTNLADGGVLILKHFRRIDPPDLKGVSVAKSKRYGNSVVTFYKKSLNE